MSYILNSTTVFNIFHKDFWNSNLMSKILGQTFTEMSDSIWTIDETCLELFKKLFASQKTYFFEKLYIIVGQMIAKISKVDYIESVHW